MMIRSNCESAAFYRCGRLEREKTDQKLTALTSLQQRLNVRQYLLNCTNYWVAILTHHHHHHYRQLWGQGLTLPSHLHCRSYIHLELTAWWRPTEPVCHQLLSDTQKRMSSLPVSIVHRPLLAPLHMSEFLVLYKYHVIITRKKLVYCQLQQEYKDCNTIQFHTIWKAWEKLLKLQQKCNQSLVCHCCWPISSGTMSWDNSWT